MIKRLRIQFTCVIMSLVMVMLGIILGVVIHFSAKSMETQSLSMMHSIADGPLQQGTLEKPSEDVQVPFFTVLIGRRGELLTARSGNYDLSDRDYIAQVTNAALASEEEHGQLDTYRLRYLKAMSPGGQTIVFWDTTAEYNTMRNLVWVGLLIYLGAGAVFLVISILLSHWVIKPVAKAWEQQRQFVADASHELKTPLSVIMSNAELLQSEDTEESERIGFAKNILTMTYQMRSLVENMLEMARVDNGTVKMVFSSVDLSQLTSDAVLSFQLLYEEQGMGLGSTIPEGIFLQGSEQHLYQVLDVLLDNALKYSTPLGTVTVTLESGSRSCLLSVSGPGEPISKEDLKNIFKRFYRADKARAINGSYGLGLSIAESIVTAHKGKIWAQSEGGRNTFFVQLPTTDHPGRLTAKG